MRRLLLSVLVLALAMAPASADAAGRKTGNFTSTALGGVFARDGATPLLLLKTKSSFYGHGAASLNVKLDGTKGTATGTERYANGTFRLEVKFTLGPAGADGTVPISGTGQIVGGTARYARAFGDVKIAGTQTSAGVVRLTIKGSVDFAPAAGSGRGQ